jgi:glycosyltransferase involved in cell wall biosynthesis
MKVGIFTGNHTQTETGIGNYIFNLIHEIKTFSGELSVIRHPNGYDYNIQNQIIPYTISSAGMMVWSCAVSAQKHLFSDLDIVHSPTLALFPIKPHEKYVLTVHDIIFKKFPQYIPKGTVRHTKLFFSHNLAIADKILADSESTMKDLIKIYHVQKDKIVIIPAAADQIYRQLSENDIQKITSKYSLFSPFILYVGTIEPRKNISMILESFSFCLKQFPEYELVIAGKKGWYYEEIFQRLEKLHIQKKVRFLGYVPLSDLPGLYNAADLFIYPSQYEGFGIPPLEAMQCGTPVITSNTSSLPEVVGDGGIMINPNDPIALAIEIKKMLNDSNLREKQIQYGLERSKLFSWKKTAEMTWEVYENIINK